ANYTSDKTYIVNHTVGKDGVQVASILLGTGGLKKVVDKVDDGVEKVGKEIISEVDDALVKQIDGADGVAKRELKKAKETGLIDTDVIESGVNELNDIATKKGNKLSWEEIQKFFKRGNDFNRKALTKYDFNEIVLENGKRLDSYIPGKEIISRKATTLSNIKPETFNNYLQELITKYKKGTKINSSKTSGVLEGDYFLEIPTSNKSFFESSSEFQKVLNDFNKNKSVNIKIKYLDE
uniref:hypothetical protein n=1 Tax=Chishuiella sp. TaxID=1969467 RepID=UPI0028A80054